jgi:hypothetical protein
MGVVGGFVALAVSLLLYSLPCAVAALRRHHNLLLIDAFNLICS